MASPDNPPTAPRTEGTGHRWLTRRLSTMMFLQYASLGLWNVTLGTYIASNTGEAGLGIFKSGFIGETLSTHAFGALLSPLLLGILADRHFSTQKLLAVLHIIASGCLVMMANCRDQWVFFVAAFVYFQAYAPTGALSSSLALRHLNDGQRDFPFVRAMGTAGWIAAGLLIGFAWRRVSGESIEATVTPMHLAIGCHLLTAGYCFTLPATPPLGRKSTGWRALAGGGALWRDRSFVVLIILSAFVMAPAQFYNGFVNPFLNLSGYEDAAGKLSLGQATEVALMIALPWLLVRFRIKALFVLGACAWAARFAMFAACGDGSNGWLAYPAILLHGASFVFVYMTGQLYIDGLADRDARAAAQGIHTMSIFGVGNLIGAIAARAAETRYLTPAGVEPPPYEWPEFWMVACAMSATGAVLFALLFSEHRR